MCELIPTARSEFVICPPPLGSPHFARGTVRGAPTRFPLRAGGTLRRGFSFTHAFMHFDPAIGIISNGIPHCSLASRQLG
jgi:hypothetical protein